MTERKSKTGDNTPGNTPKGGRRPPWKRGESGNPDGRPKGSRNRATLAAEALLDGEAEALSRKVVEMALDGDTTALKMCMDRILPPRKGRPITFTLPEMTDTGDLRAVALAILKAVSEGVVTPEEAVAVAPLIKAAANLDGDNISSDASMSSKFQEMSDEELEKRFAALGLKLPSVD